MTNLDSAAHFSSIMAPVVDRLVISVGYAVDKEALLALRGGHRFHPAAISLLAPHLAAGAFSVQQFNELSRYQHFGSTEQYLAGMAERGAIVIGKRGSIVPTVEGQEMAQNIVRLQGTTVENLWKPRAHGVSALVPLIRRCAAAAVASETPLARFADTRWLPAEAPDAMRLWADLYVLRLHRADSHAAAWTEAGLTVEEIKALAPGEQRTAIEIRTNELSGAAWDCLSTDERLVVLAEGGALPGNGFPL